MNLSIFKKGEIPPFKKNSINIRNTSSATKGGVKHINLDVTENYVFTVLKQTFISK